MNIALIAHDNRKQEIIQLAIEYKQLLKNHVLFATGTTGKLIAEATELEIHRFLSGPMGGDQQIGAKVAGKEMDMVIFLRDPLTAQPHEPDVSALLRVCDVHDTPLATNKGTARLLLETLNLE